MSANGVFTSTIDYSFFGGGYSTIEGGVSGAIDVAFTSDVIVPVQATFEHILGFGFVGGIVTPTVYAEAAGDISFTLSNAFIEFGIQSYLFSGNNEISFTGSATALAPISVSFTPTFDINFSGTMAQFSLGQTTGAFAYALNSKGQNYTLLNKSRPNKKNGINLTDAQHNGVTLRMQPNGVKIRDNGTNYVEIR
tara:strand:+ start:3587 stop:4168 length:582 start_codon:yes stop_codon:yes gene_type:complete